VRTGFDVVHPLQLVAVVSIARLDARLVSASFMIRA
jgi:hypothetical protein